MAEEKKEEKKAKGEEPKAEAAETAGADGTTGTAKTASVQQQGAEPSQKSQSSQKSQKPVEPDKPEKAVEPEKPAEPEKNAAEKPAEPDWKTLYAMALADFDNYKKRAARDREDVYRYAEADILKDILPTVDNLALALANAGGLTAVSAADGTERVSPGAASDSFVKGVQLVYDTLLKALKDHGAEPFDSVGKDLDTEKMEAIATLPSAEVPEGKVSIESKRGWMLKDRVLRAAQVVVSSGKPA